MINTPNKIIAICALIAATIAAACFFVTTAKQPSSTAALATAPSVSSVLSAIPSSVRVDLHSALFERTEPLKLIITDKRDMEDIVRHVRSGMPVRLRWSCMDLGSITVSYQDGHEELFGVMGPHYLVRRVGDAYEYLTFDAFQFDMLLNDIRKRRALGPNDDK